MFICLYSFTHLSISKYGFLYICLKPYLICKPRTATGTLNQPGAQIGYRLDETNFFLGPGTASGNLQRKNVLAFFFCVGKLWSMDVSVGYGLLWQAYPYINVEPEARRLRFNLWIE